VRRTSARIALFLALSLTAAAAARKPKPPGGTLTLDMNAPIVIATIGNVDLRLRVAPDQKRLIELNPAAAKRLSLPFEGGIQDAVGRVPISAQTTGAEVRLNGRRFGAQILSHDRDCCADVDGEIGITLLPYAVVNMARAAPDGGLTEQRYLIEDSDERGPQTRLRKGKDDIFAAFSLSRQQSVGTFSAGVILASAYGGKLARGTAVPLEAAFGIMRPTRMLQFQRPANVAGFLFDQLPIRIADFGGRYDFAQDDEQLAGDIVVTRRTAPQEAWPMVLIGRDRLDRCARLRFEMATKMLTISCVAPAAP